MTELWRKFWEDYRLKAATSEADLFVQVGRTVNGIPISSEEFQRGVDHVAATLELSGDDVLFEFCCGNGLVCSALAPRVRAVIGLDFTEHLIAAARQWRGGDNVRYHLGDAVAPLHPLVGAHPPNKYLMGYALQHFGPEELGTILANILAVMNGRPFLFLATGVPDAERKWNFYDTPERKERHRAHERQGDLVNDGMGRWWRASELAEIAARAGLVAQVTPEPDGLTNYRMDVLFRPRSR